ncbi:MAG: hypothetical protein KDC92_09175 [Bacteroidetes bacterium]|nr:hypothetical protein [Bacteroidota bacterium]
MNKQRMMILGFIISAAIVGAFYLFEKTEHKDGGPCSYSTTTFPAVITDIVPASESTSYISCKVKRQDSTYTILETVSNNELNKGAFKIGSVLTFVNKQIIEGACNPDVSFLDVAKYGESIYEN